MLPLTMRHNDRRCLFQQMVCPVSVSFDFCMFRCQLLLFSCFLLFAQLLHVSLKDIVEFIVNGECFLMFFMILYTKH